LSCLDTHPKTTTTLQRLWIPTVQSQNHEHKYT